MIGISLDLSESLGNLGVVSLGARSILRHRKTKHVVVLVIKLSWVKAFRYEMRKSWADRVSLHDPVKDGEEPEHVVS